MSNSILKAQVQDGGALIVFSGHLNSESSPILTGLLNSIKGPRVTFDLEDIRNINSAGVQAWLWFMAKVSAQYAVEFRNCSPDVVFQMNMIWEFSGAAQVTSVFREMRCSPCEASHLIRIESKDFPQKDGPEMVVPCPRCKAALDPEESDEEFFAFLDVNDHKAAG